MELQLYFQSRNKNAHEESKQDGLLLLEFSNSQSRKEFTFGRRILPGLRDNVIPALGLN